ncbi:MAG: DUF6252 family protein [Sediminibacterium sp.]|nr:DUF6252 family protein [Sediminibacterium sp.]
MKSFLIIAASFVLLSSSCRKNKPVNPIDQLPPETQTGANTFGCLVDGEVFKPGGAQLSGGSLGCNYQFLGTGANGGYYFRLSGVKGSGNNQTAVGLFTDSLKIQEGVKYLLDSSEKGKAYSHYSNLANGSSQNEWFYKTKKTNFGGELWIKKLDTVNQIVSGTFWFDAVNANGQKVQIREGRFDVRYTR